MKFSFLVSTLKVKVNTMQYLENPALLVNQTKLAVVLSF